MPDLLTIARIPNREIPTAAWADGIDQLGAALGAPDNPTLLPPHFLKSAFRRLGGEIFSVNRGGEMVGAGFLLPGPLSPTGERTATLRFHAAPQAGPVDVQAVADRVAAQLALATVRLYDTGLSHAFVPTHNLQDGLGFRQASSDGTEEFASSDANVGHLRMPDSATHQTSFDRTLDLGRPDAAEAEQIRRLQQKVWMVADEYLYPADIHTPDFGLANSLVARDGEGGPVVGSLFGFFKWDGSGLPQPWSDRFQHDLRIESQSLAVEPDFRGRNIAFHLKRMQAQQALAAGVDLVEWTTDPLLFANAVLNFGKLRAICTQFYADLIPFRNVLNQLPASRLRMTLLPGTDRVQNALTDPGADRSNQDLSATTVQVNDGWATPLFNINAPTIAVEIPADWAALQRTDLPAAARWRETTDRLLAHYVGTQPGQYILTAPAREGDRRFLVGERVDDGLLARLGEGVA